MPKRRTARETGAGITRYRTEQTVYDLTQPLTHEEKGELIAGIRAAAARPLWSKDRIIRHAESELAKSKATLPADHDDLDFRPHDDWGWYYSQLVRLDRILRNAIETGEAGRAALFAEDFGAVRAELDIKLVWEKRALAGGNSLRGASDGGRLRGTSYKIQDRRTRFFDSYDEAISRNTHPTIARQRAAKQEGYNDDYARRLLNSR